jgi:hypothetical protein
VEQAATTILASAPFKLAYGIACAAAGRLEIARDIRSRAPRNRFTEIAFDHVWLTTIIGYAVLAIELADAGAAALLMPIVEPYADVVAFNGATSQGPVAAYVGKLASLLDRHEVAEEHLMQALDTATSFGWTYHRATTLYAPRPGSLPPRSERSMPSARRGSPRQRTCPASAAFGVGRFG